MAREVGSGRGLEMGNMGSAGCGCTGLSSTRQIMIASTPRRQRFSDSPCFRILRYLTYFYDNCKVDIFEEKKIRSKYII